MVEVSKSCMRLEFSHGNTEGLLLSTILAQVLWLFV